MLRANMGILRNLLRRLALEGLHDGCYNSDIMLNAAKLYFELEEYPCDEDEPEWLDRQDMLAAEDPEE